MSDVQSFRRTTTTFVHVLTTLWECSSCSNSNVHKNPVSDLLFLFHKYLYILGIYSKSEKVCRFCFLVTKKLRKSQHQNVATKLRKSLKSLKNQDHVDQKVSKTKNMVIENVWPFYKTIQGFTFQGHPLLGCMKDNCLTKISVRPGRLTE